MSVADKCAGLPLLPRRIVALVLVPLCLALASAGLLEVGSLLVDVQRSWRLQARSVFAQAHDAAAVQARLDQDLAQVNASPAWSKFYSSPIPGGGTVLLQSDIGTLLSAAQISVQSLAPVPSVPVHEFTRIGVRLTASMRINQLQSMLAAAANHQHYLRVEQLTVLAPQMQMPNDNPPLAVIMEIYGFELPSGGVADATSAVAMRSGSR